MPFVWKMESQEVDSCDPLSCPLKQRHQYFCMQQSKRMAGMSDNRANKIGW